MKRTDSKEISSFFYEIPYKNIKRIIRWKQMNQIEKKMKQLQKPTGKRITSFGFLVITGIVLLVFFGLGRGIAYFIAKEDCMKPEREETLEEVNETESMLLDSAGNQVCIVVDAGHGGKDPGKVGDNNVLEKDINLSIATKLSERLQELGIHIIMTRTSNDALCSDTDKNQKITDLNNRIKLIEESSPTFVVSIHQNSYTDGSVKGAQVFYLAADSEGKKLASFIQNSLNKEIEFEKPREIKGNGSYYLLKKAPAVTAIVECGFLSNKEECQLLTEDSYQEKIVEAITKGILEYLGGFTE